MTGRIQAFEQGGAGPGQFMVNYPKVILRCSNIMVNFKDFLQIRGGRGQVGPHLNPPMNEISVCPVHTTNKVIGHLISNLLHRKCSLKVFLIDKSTFNTRDVITDTSHGNVNHVHHVRRTTLKNNEFNNYMIYLSLSTVDSGTCKVIPSIDGYLLV